MEKTEKKEKEITRREMGKELLKSAVHVALPPAAVLAVGSFTLKPLAERMGRLRARLSDHYTIAPERLSPRVTGYKPALHSYGFGIDTRACIGCGRCVRACKVENHVPFSGHAFRTWVERYEITSKREVHVDSPEGGMESFPLQHASAEGDEVENVVRNFFVPKLCNQCEFSPCHQVCPVGATFKTPDGIVLVDRTRCIGCGYCVQTCPYGARFKDPEMHVIDKCTWCYHRIIRGLKPACVEACPRRARIFGSLDDPKSDIRVFLRQKDIYVLKEELGTEPRAFYTGYRLGVA